MFAKAKRVPPIAAGIACGLASFAAQAIDGPQNDVMFVAATTDCGPAFDERVNIAVEPKIDAVKGAPYSGVGTTEVVTTLADGNRILRTNTMRYTRDSQGRTRTEYSLGAIGPFTPNEAQTVVTIMDPVQGKRYVLHSALKRADVFDMSDMPAGKIAAAGGAAGGAKWFTLRKGASPSDAGEPRAGTAMVSPRGAGPAAVSPPVVVMSRNASLPPANVGFIMQYWATETAVAGASGDGCKPNSKPLPAPTSLGERIIEGLKATGTRMEFTIAAGAVGNEQPIVVSSEQWFSPDLGVVVSSTHRDPMMGDTTYRLEQISRAEPDASLFTIPADYTQSEVPSRDMFFEKALPTPPPGTPSAESGVRMRVDVPSFKGTPKTPGTGR
jgi:hypothetical protein